VNLNAAGADITNPGECPIPHLTLVSAAHRKTSPAREALLGCERETACLPASNVLNSQVQNLTSAQKHHHGLRDIPRGGWPSLTKFFHSGAEPALPRWPRPTSSSSNSFLKTVVSSTWRGQLRPAPFFEFGRFPAPGPNAYFISGKRFNRGSRQAPS